MDFSHSALSGLLTQVYASGFSIGYGRRRPTLDPREDDAVANGQARSGDIDSGQSFEFQRATPFSWYGRVQSIAVAGHDSMIIGKASASSLCTLVLPVSIFVFITSISESSWLPLPAAQLTTTAQQA